MRRSEKVGTIRPGCFFGKMGLPHILFTKKYCRKARVIFLKEVV